MVYIWVHPKQNGWKAILWSKIDVLWDDASYLKSPAMLFTKQSADGSSWLELSNEILSALGDSNLIDVKVWGYKMMHACLNLLNQSRPTCIILKF